MTLKEKSALRRGAIVPFTSSSPGLMLTICSRALLTAFSPFINIFLSALIINALAQGQSFQQILALIFLTVLLNVGASLISSGLSRRQSFFLYKFWQVSEQPLNEKIQQMDYELVENPEIHLKKQQIVTLRYANGLGLPRLIWCTEGLIQGVASVIFLGFPAEHRLYTFLFDRSGDLVLSVFPLVHHAYCRAHRPQYHTEYFHNKKSIKKLHGIFLLEFVPLSRLSGYYFPIPFSIQLRQGYAHLCPQSDFVEGVSERFSRHQQSNGKTL